MKEFENLTVRGFKGSKCFCVAQSACDGEQEQYSNALIFF